SGGAEDERPGADAGDPGRGRATPGDEIERLVVGQERVHPRAAGDTEEVERGRLVQRAIGAEQEPPFALDRTGPGTDEHDADARRGAEALVRPGEIELGEIREDQETGSQRACSHGPEPNGARARR